MIFLAYGLFNLPIYLWNYADNNYQLLLQLRIANKTIREYREALVDYQTMVSQCKNLAEQYRTSANTKYMDLLMEEMPKQDLEGQNIVYSKHMRFDIDPDKDINEDYIAMIRYTLKCQYFLYKRKKARWVTLFNKVDDLIERPVVYEQEYLLRDIRKMDFGNADVVNLDELVLKPKTNHPKRVTFFRVLSILGFVLCGIVIVTEGTVIFNYKYTLLYWVMERHGQYKFFTFLFSITYLASLTLVCFFSIFNWRVSDYMQLVPNHTDCITF